jgi:hypothetical protein
LFLLSPCVPISSLPSPVLPSSLLILSFYSHPSTSSPLPVLPSLLSHQLRFHCPDPHSLAFRAWKGRPTCNAGTGAAASVRGTHRCYRNCKCSWKWNTETA